VLKVIDVVKRYGERLALNGVCLEVSPGEVLGLLGPNGAGKSTLVSIVAGLKEPDAGQVTVDGFDVVTESTKTRPRVGLAPQDTGLYEVLTVRENLTFFAELAGLGKRERMSRIGELAEGLRFTGLLNRTAFELSGGERRRVHTAIALVNRPPVLLLDEATVGADIETRAALLAFVRTAANDGAAIVYTTHYLPEVEALDAAVALLVDGQIIARGLLDELVAAHGRTGVELSFDGPAPDLHLDNLQVVIDGNTLLVETSEPAAVIPALMMRLGPDAERVRSVELLRPSLDNVFLTLTGRRYQEENLDVTAA
jgi:ABC-2 type transport system ATP-binding protein